MQPGDVVISVGKIFEAITATTDVPSSNHASAPDGAGAADRGDPVRRARKS